MGGVLSSILGGGGGGDETSYSEGASGVTAIHSSARWQLHFNELQDTSKLVNP